jgi:hypothetical protein
MHGKLGIFLIAVVPMIVACSHPRYPAESGRGGQAAEPKLAECTAKFANGACVGMEWEAPPTEAEYASFVFTLFNETSDGPVRFEPGRAPVVVLWMPGMGHGSSPVTVERLPDGNYRASKVFFSMRGRWDIRIQLKEGNAVVDQAVIGLDL